MDPTNKTLKTVIGDEEALLYFDANTFMAWEVEMTGRFFMDWFFGIHDNMGKMYREQAMLAARAKREQEKADSKLSKEEFEEFLRGLELNPMRIYSLVSVTEFTTLIWAAWHRYSDSGKPAWDHTRDQVGALIDGGTIITLFPEVIRTLSFNLTSGHQPKNGKPTDTEAEAERPTSPTPAKRLSGGGKTFGPTQSEVLGSLKRK